MLSAGLETLGVLECNGRCEIDKYVNQVYSAIYAVKGELYFYDARAGDPNDMPNIGLICLGVLCRPFSIAGPQNGFDDANDALFLRLPELPLLKDHHFCFFKMFPAPFV